MSVSNSAVFSEMPCFGGLMWASSFSGFKYSTGCYVTLQEDATDGMISRLLGALKQKQSVLEINA